MRIFPSLATGAIATALLLTGAAAPAAKKDRSPDAELARAIEGRVQGEPVNCLYQRDIRSTRIIDGKAIIYETNNRTLYVNTPQTGAQSLRWSTVLVTDTRTSQLCSIDVVYLYDNASRMQQGFVGLGKFVPYTKPKKSKG